MTNSRSPVSRFALPEGLEVPTSATYGAFVVCGTFLSDTARFEISRTEARGFDPTVMLILETTYGALQAQTTSWDCRTSLANVLVGCFLGTSGSVSAEQRGGPRDDMSEKTPSVHAATARALAVLSGRVSYALGLTGPCLTTDTACSSCLVVAHLAASALKLVECPRAAVTGAWVLTGMISVAFSAAGMLSALGRCHTFDRRADGYCRGEGVGAFVFSAPESGDVAVSGSAVQQDGPSASLAAPNGSSQQRLIEAVHERGSSPALEAHGTGTALGDPIEARVATRALWWTLTSFQVGAANRALC